MNIEILYMKSAHLEYVLENFLEDNYNYIILTSDSWDDYSFKTNFKMMIIKDNNQYENMYLKIAFNDSSREKASYEILDEYLEENEIDIFNFKEPFNDFISIGDSYDKLQSLFSYDEFLFILKTLNDVLYLKEFDNENLLSLFLIKESPVFKVSLLRGQYQKKVYYEGLSSILDSNTDSSKHFFDFNFSLGKREYQYDFDFRDENNLPSRINVLIGKNGVGKTKTLETLVEYLVNPIESIGLGKCSVSEHPNFLSNLIVFSYNLYEKFYISKASDNISIKYKYLGFRRYKTLDDGIDLKTVIDSSIDLEILQKINETYHKEILEFNGLSLEEQKNSYSIFIKRISEESSYNIENVTNSLDLILKIINEEIIDTSNHDKIAIASILELDKQDSIREKYGEEALISQIILHIESAIPEIVDLGLKDSTGAIYFYEGSSTLYDLNLDVNEILFFNEKQEEVHLSSGQKVFINLIINLFSMIAPNSLIVIDEPENTLHPNFEVNFIRILQDILEEYNSFAIIATHSTIITREIPKKFVNIILTDDDTNEVEIQKPHFNTFGASITDITNYIFDDIFLKNKPYSEWLKTKISEFESFENFHDAYKDILSYELLLEANSLMSTIDD